MPSKAQQVPSVFVRGLPFTASEEQLSAHFSDIAPVKRAIIVRDRTTHESRGFGFVQFALDDDATVAADRLNGKEFQGRRLNVEVSAGPGAALPTTAGGKPFPPARGNTNSSSSSSSAASSSSSSSAAPVVVGTKRRRPEESSASGSGSGHTPSFAAGASGTKLSHAHPVPEGEKRSRTLVLFGIAAGIDKKRLWKRVRKTTGAKELTFPVSLPGREGVACAFILYEAQRRRDVAERGLEGHSLHGGVLRARRAEDLFSPFEAFSRARLIVRNLRFDATDAHIRNAIKRLAPTSVVTDVYVPVKAQGDRDVADNSDEDEEDSEEEEEESDGEDSEDEDGSDEDEAEEDGAGKTKKKGGKKSTASTGPRNRGFAFIECATRKDAETVIAALNEKKIHRRIVAVDFALSQAAYKAEKDKAAAAPAVIAAAADGEAGDGDEAVAAAAAGEKEDDAEAATDAADGDDSEGEEENGDDAGSDDDAAEDGDGDGDVDIGGDSDEDEDEEDDDDAEAKADGAASTTSGETGRSVLSVAPGDPEALGCTLFLRNLAFDVDEKELIAAFRVFGPVHYATLVRDREDGRPKGTGFVKFYRKDGADRALTAAGTADEHCSDFRTPREGEKDAAERARASYAIAVDAALLNGGVKVGGRVLNARRAVSKDEAAALAAAYENKDGISGGKKYDKRHTYLSYEGSIRAGTDAANMIPKSDLLKREEAAKAKKKKLTSPLFFVSPTRLSVRNLAKHVDDKSLRQLADDGVREGIRGRLVDLNEGDPRLMPPKGEKTPRIYIATARVMRESPDLGGPGGGARGPNRARVEEDGVTMRSKGFGFVEFSCHLHALAFLRQVNNNPTYSLSHAAGGAAARTKPEEEKPRLIVEFAIENISKVREHEEKKAAAAAKRGAMMEAGLASSAGPRAFPSAAVGGGGAAAGRPGQQQQQGQPRFGRQSAPSSSNGASAGPAAAGAGRARGGAAAAAAPAPRGRPDFRSAAGGNAGSSSAPSSSSGPRGAPARSESRASFGSRAGSERRVQFSSDTKPGPRPGPAQARGGKGRDTVDHQFDRIISEASGSEFQRGGSGGKGAAAGGAGGAGGQAASSTTPRAGGGGGGGDDDENHPRGGSSSSSLRAPMLAAEEVAFLDGDDEEEDEDVAAEEERVVEGLNSMSKAAREGRQPPAAILLHGLIKEYPARIRKSKKRTVGGASGDHDEKHLLRDALRAVQSVLPSAIGGHHQMERAVDRLSLRVDYGECLGLLGPNGAGKTTTIACLTGHSSISGGLAFVGGFDVATELDAVWRTLGVCPQFDTVWDDLSVKDHLTFYARVKGVALPPPMTPEQLAADLAAGGRAAAAASNPSFWSIMSTTFLSILPTARLRAAVQQVAESVELDGDPLGQPARVLSGGQRRRLSIGISLIGSPKVIFLDEPTTGLDVSTVREVHRIIAAQQTAGRAMILTTHSLSEAEQLCSNIAIVARGRLKALGPPLALKRKYGDGYRLSITLAVPPGISTMPGGPRFVDAVAAAAHAFIVENVHNEATMVSRVGASVTYVLPRTGIDVAAVFSILEAHKRGGGAGAGGAASHAPLFVEYGLSQTTLENVFVRVVEAAEAAAERQSTGVGVVIA